MFGIMLSMIKIFPALKKLANLLKFHAKLYIVGGYIRDSLLGIKSTDCDLCSKLKIDELEQILYDNEYKIIPSNKQFGTAKIQYKNFTFEYSTFRKDFYNPNGKHSPKKIEFVTTIEEDCIRRDFTINAIYFDIIENQIIDPFNALEDIKNKVLKAVPNTPKTLSIDGERLLRLARFSAKLGLKIEENTLLEAKQYQNNIKELSENTIKKFLHSTEKCTNIERQNIKKILQSLNAFELANKIKED